MQASDCTHSTRLAVAQYLLFLSQDPFAIKEHQYVQNLASNLCESGHEVVVFLVANGVFSARNSLNNEPLKNLLAKGVKVWADEFSLRERGIEDRALLMNLEKKVMDDAMVLIAHGSKTIWH